MAQAINNLEKLQFGMQSAFGTLVAADTVIVCENGGDFQPEIDRVALEEPQGVLAMVEDIDVRKGTLLTYRHALDFQQIAIPIALGLDADNPQQDSTTYTRTVTPSMTAPDALSVGGTFEVSYTDGSSRHLQVEFGDAFCRRFVIGAAFNQPATFEAEFFGRAVQSSTFTASQAPLTRQQIPSNKWTAAIDTAWSALGDTSKAGLVKSFEFEVITGVEPDYALSARTDLDYTHVRRGPITARCRMKMIYDAAGDTEYDAWAAKTARFLELTVAGTSPNALTLSLSGIYAEPPRFSVENGIRMVELVLEGRYDPTSGNLLSIVLVNELASI